MALPFRHFTMTFDIGVGQTASHWLGSVGTGLTVPQFFRLFEAGLVGRLTQSLFKHSSRESF